MQELELSIAKLIELAQTLDKAKEGLKTRINELEAENTELKAMLHDGWTDRVTYDNTVEQIASYEDPAQRDEARKLIEPMLKKNMVRKFRADIKRKVNELNGGDKGATFNNYGTYTEVQAGGININNKNDGGN